MNVAVFEETVRRHLTSAGYLVFLFLVATAGLFAAGFNKPASMWPSLVTLLAIITGSALIGPEFLTGTLQLIVTKPVPRPVYVLSRVAGVFAAVCLAAVAGFGAESIVRLASGADAVPWRRLIDAFGGSLLAALLIIAFLTLLGSLTRAYLNVAIYLTIEVALSILESVIGVVRVKGGAVGAYLEAHPGLERGLTAFDDFLFPVAPQQLQWPWILRIVATAAVALLLACLAFQRREVPYGAE